MMKCSIVIATFNRAPVLRATLERLCALPQCPPIVVVDNGSSDETGRIAHSFGRRIRLERLPENLGAAARTVGARLAETPLLAFCDDDCWWAPDALSIAAERFARNERLGVINARVLVRGEQKVDPACCAMRASAAHGREGNTIQYFMAGASIIRRDAFLEAGGYHERYLIGAEESLLSLDLAARGWEFWYCDDVVLHHFPSPINRVPAVRKRLTFRNRLWTVWLRHSLPTALRATGRYITRARYDPIVRFALYDAIRGLPWIVRERRPIPRDLERRILPVTAPVFD